MALPVLADPAPADPVAAFRSALPPESSGFRRSGGRHFGGGLGESVRFSAVNGAGYADIFLYDKNETLPPQDDRRLAAVEMTSALADLRHVASQGHYPELRGIGEGTRSIGSPPIVYAWHRFSFLAPAQMNIATGKRVETTIYVGLWRRHYIKLRITMLPGTDNLRAEEALVQDISQRLAGTAR